MKKEIVAIVLMCVLLLVFASAVYAAPNGGASNLYDELKNQRQGTVADQINPANGSSGDTKEILNAIDDKVSQIVTTVRVIATIGAVVFVIWLGIIFFTSGGDPRTLANAKTQVGLFFVSLICIFLAEPIVRFILSWFIGTGH